MRKVQPSVVEQLLRVPSGFAERRPNPRASRSITRALSFALPWVLLAPAGLRSARATDISSGNPAFPTAYRLSLLIRDPEGAPLAARVRILGSDALVHPDSLDHARLSHAAGGGFFYADGSAWVNIPAGNTRVTVGRGFEWQPHDRTYNIVRDSTLTITLQRFVDLGTEGWFGGEIHSHTQHDPADYQITPFIARRIARAEGLSVIHLLDQSYQFTGTPHYLSDAQTILYYSYEYRNQTYGHIPLPGLRQYAGESCCRPGYPPYPMILDIRKDVVPAKGPMIVLGHPHTTSDYFYDEGWPGWGLGRELPALAALGGLDALDVVSYSNDPDEDWSEWYDVLSAGYPCPPSAGTDALLDFYYSLPPGGWRVYADLGQGASLDYDQWVEALRTGRTFVTNYPLIPDFHIADVGPGELYESAGDTLQALVHIRALCVLGVQRVSLIAEGDEIWHATITGTLPPRTEVDTTFTLRVPTPSWINARVLGNPGNPHALLMQPQAQTNAIRITRDGLPIRRTASSARMCDLLDSLTAYVTLEGGWSAPWQRDTVLIRVNRARLAYLRAFVVPPDPFNLITPAAGETVYAGSLYLDWEPARDAEAGDDVDYILRVSDDSTMVFPRQFRLEDHGFGDLNVPPDHSYWWNVDAIDRGGNARTSTPSLASFYLGQDPSAVEEALAASADRPPRGQPNPSAGTVRIEGLAPPIAIYDATGRRVAATGAGVIASQDGSLLWDGLTSGGRRAPPGLYWARGARGRVARLIRLQ